MTVDLNAVLTFLLLIAALIGAIITGFLRVKKWVRDVAVPAEQAAAELQSIHGKTVAATIEQTARDIHGIHSRLDEHAKEARETRDIALDARARANAVGDRLDQHLIREHGANASRPEEN